MSRRSVWLLVLVYAADLRPILPLPPPPYCHPGDDGDARHDA